MSNFVSNTDSIGPDHDTVKVVVSEYHRNTFEGHGLIIVTSADKYSEGVSAHLSLGQIEQLIEGLQDAVNYLTSK